MLPVKQLEMVNESRISRLGLEEYYTKERIALVVGFCLFPLIIFICAAAGAFSDSGLWAYFGFFASDASSWLLPFMIALEFGFFICYLKTLAKRRDELASLERTATLRKIKTKDDAQAANTKTLESQIGYLSQQLEALNPNLGAETADTKYRLAIPVQGAKPPTRRDTAAERDELLKYRKPDGEKGVASTEPDANLNAVGKNFSSTESENAKILDLEQKVNELTEGSQRKDLQIANLVATVAHMKNLDEESGESSILTDSSEEAAEIVTALNGVSERLVTLVKNTASDDAFDDKIFSITRLAKALRLTQNLSGGAEAVQSDRNQKREPGSGSGSILNG